MQPPHRALATRVLRWQFSTRTLLAGVAGAALLFAVYKVLSGLWSLTLTLVLCLVGAHLFATAWGNRLRLHAAQRDAAAGTEALCGAPRKTDAGSHDAPPAPSTRQQIPASSLVERTPLSWVVGATVAVGATLGTIGGVLLLASLDLPEMTAAALAVGGLSCGALGGFLGFLAGSFLEVALGALFAAAYWESPGRLRRPFVLRLAGVLLLLAAAICGLVAGQVYLGRLFPWDDTPPDRSAWQWFLFLASAAAASLSGLAGTICVATAQVTLNRRSDAA